MSQSKGRSNRGSRKKIGMNDNEKKSVESVDENSLVIQQFRAYASELDDKHDRFERILKIGRDITITSKRIISLLHTIDTKSKHEQVLSDGKLKLQNVVQHLFKTVAKELENQDPYQYLKAYRSGLEEYIEALTFYQYLQNGVIEDWTEVKQMLSYTISEKDNVTTIQALVTPQEYILGVADLIGELMRKCINNLATEDIASCFHICNFVRHIYTGFLGCSNISNKEMNRKLSTLRESLHKMENVCYTIKVRGSEIPKHILMDVATEDSDIDEGYQVY